MRLLIALCLSALAALPASAASLTGLPSRVQIGDDVRFAYRDEIASGVFSGVFAFDFSHDPSLVLKQVDLNPLFTDVPNSATPPFGASGLILESQQGATPGMLDIVSFAAPAFSLTGDPIFTLVFEAVALDGDAGVEVTSLDTVTGADLATVSASVSIVPLPATAWLLLGGLGMALALKRSARRA